MEEMTILLALLFTLRVIVSDPIAKAVAFTLPATRKSIEVEVPNSFSLCPPVVIEIANASFNCFLSNFKAR
jgi:hypothetical protein